MKKLLTTLLAFSLLGISGCDEQKLTQSSAKFDEPFQTALSKYNSEQYQEAFDDFKELADKGYAPAELKVVEMLLDGKGIRRNEPLAVDRLKKSAEKGEVAMQYRLGEFYYSGQLNRLPKDYHQAKNLFEKAAEKKHSPAQLRLGEMYQNGWGTSQNKQTAKEWFGKACDNGSQKGCEQYRTLLEQGY
ncbi:tetratricopeptide repeat protein [Mannheimia indoligenes]|uniref:tetratricopeptide repeat protein n=1 Tax=Mannheimia indoligenes TaxID=3103145 RepID=UPI002FE683C4